MERWRKYKDLPIFPQQNSDMVWLGRLIGCVGKHHTRGSALRSIAQTLHEFASLSSLEMFWEAESYHWIRLECRQDGAVLEQGTEESLSGPVRSHLSQSTVDSIDVYRSQGQEEDGPEVLVIIPLTEAEKIQGCVCLRFQDMSSLTLLEESNLLPALQPLLSLLYRTTDVMSRVAQVSRQAYRKNKQLREELEQYTQSTGWDARSPVMLKVLEQARAVARHDTTVLLTGESGTGKERLARTIHQYSARAGQPFIQVNCGAWPEPLIASELFGHEKGAFTGASRRHIGCFERAHQGTLLLDEVAELPLSSQVKLLRVLQEGTFERVGGEQTIRVNVRVLAATHQSLETWVQEGRFRADLYYRLNVFPLLIPPLRERLEDLPFLTQDILAHKAKLLDCAVPTLPPTLFQRFLSYPWPGNIRELENILERVVILSAQGLSWHDILTSLPFTEPTLPTQEAEVQQEVCTIETWEEATARCIRRALQASQGQIYGDTGAAARLGLKPSTLQSKMKKLQISRKPFL